MSASPHIDGHQIVREGLVSFVNDPKAVRKVTRGTVNLPLVNAEIDNFGSMAVLFITCDPKLIPQKLRNHPGLLEANNNNTTLLGHQASVHLFFILLLAISLEVICLLIEIEEIKRAVLPVLTLGLIFRPEVLLFFHRQRHRVLSLPLVFEGFFLIIE